MPAVGEVSFELERFEWTADDRLEVVGRWNGVRGRRIARPALTVEAGGRRQRLTGTQVSEEPWSASFAWSGDDIAGAELEIGRTLVVELPPPRRRRRRSGASAESDLRAQLDEARLALAAVQAEREDATELRAALAAAEAELATLREDAGRDETRAAAEAELATLRERDAELTETRAALAAAEAELAALREDASTRVDADEGAELTRVRAALEAAERERDLLAGELRARDDEAARPDEARAALEAERDEALAAAHTERDATLAALAAAEEERDRLAARAEDAARVDTQRDDRSAELAAALDERDRLLETARTESAERDSLATELDAVRAERAPRAEAEQELAGLRLAHGSLKAAHEALEDELEDLRELRDERDELVGQIEQLKASAGDEASEKTSLTEVIRELQGEREVLSADLAVAREEIARLERDLSDRNRDLERHEQDAERRIESERATNTEIHARLATAREETQKTIAAESEETERLRAELEQLRAEHERAVGAERAEVARLREELLSSEVDEGADEASRRMVERVTRDLERERAVSRNLKRELDTLRSDLAEQRRQLSASTANGTLQMDDAPARAVRTPEGTRRRVDAARANSAQRVPKVGPSPVALWTVRVLATALVAFLGILLVILIKTFT